MTKTSVVTAVLSLGIVPLTKALITGNPAWMETKTHLVDK